MNYIENHWNTKFTQIPLIWSPLESISQRDRSRRNGDSPSKLVGWPTWLTKLTERRKYVSRRRCVAAGIIPLRKRSTLRLLFQTMNWEVIWCLQNASSFDSSSEWLFWKVFKSEVGEMRRHLGIKSDCILEWGDEFSHFQSWTRFEILSAIFRVCLEIRNPQSTNLQETLFNATQIGVVNQLGCSLATNDLRQWFSRVNQSHFLRKCILKLFSHHWFLLGESNERSWAAGHFIIPNGHHWEDSKKMGLSVVIPPKTNGLEGPKMMGLPWFQGVGRL